MKSLFINKIYEISFIIKCFFKKDLIEGHKVLKSKQITMSTKTLLFEKKFANYMGVKYGVMVNSGSSANLLALSLITNPMRERKLNIGDEVIFPLCWSTWLTVQHGLSPFLLILILTI